MRIALSPANVTTSRRRVRWNHLVDLFLPNAADHGPRQARERAKGKGMEKDAGERLPQRIIKVALVALVAGRRSWRTKKIRWREHGYGGVEREASEGWEQSRQLANGAPMAPVPRRWTASSIAWLFRMIRSAVAP